MRPIEYAIRFTMPDGEVVHLAGDAAALKALGKVFQAAMKLNKFLPLRDVGAAPIEPEIVVSSDGSVVATLPLPTYPTIDE